MILLGRSIVDLADLFVFHDNEYVGGTNQHSITAVFANVGNSPLSEKDRKTLNESIGTGFYKEYTKSGLQHIWPSTNYKDATGMSCYVFRHYPIKIDPEESHNVGDKNSLTGLASTSTIMSDISKESHTFQLITNTYNYYRLYKCAYKISIECKSSDSYYTNKLFNFVKLSNPADQYFQYLHGEIKTGETGTIATTSSIDNYVVDWPFKIDKPTDQYSSSSNMLYEVKLHDDEYIDSVIDAYIEPNTTLYERTTTITVYGQYDQFKGITDITPRTGYASYSYTITQKANVLCFRTTNTTITFYSSDDSSATPFSSNDSYGPATVMKSYGFVYFKITGVTGEEGDKEKDIFKKTVVYGSMPNQTANNLSYDFKDANNNSLYANVSTPTYNYQTGIWTAKVIIPAAGDEGSGVTKTIDTSNAVVSVTGASKNSNGNYEISCTWGTATIDVTGIKGEIKANSTSETSYTFSVSLKEVTTTNKYIWTSEKNAGYNSVNYKQNGKTVVLTESTFTPSFTYSSSNISVATVDNYGVVTFLPTNSEEANQVTITVKCDDTDWSKTITFIQTGSKYSFDCDKSIVFYDKSKKQINDSSIIEISSDGETQTIYFDIVLYNENNEKKYLINCDEYDFIYDATNINQKIQTNLTSPYFCSEFKFEKSQVAVSDVLTIVRKENQLISEYPSEEDSCNYAENKTANFTWYLPKIIIDKSQQTKTYELVVKNSTCSKSIKFQQSVQNNITTDDFTLDGYIEITKDLPSQIKDVSICCDWYRINSDLYKDDFPNDGKFDDDGNATWHVYGGLYDNNSGLITFKFYKNTSGKYYVVKCVFHWELKYNGDVLYTCVDSNTDTHTTAYIYQNYEPAEDVIEYKTTKIVWDKVTFSDYILGLMTESSSFFSSSLYTEYEHREYCVWSFTEYENSIITKYFTFWGTEYKTKYVNGIETDETTTSRIQSTCANTFKFLISSDGCNTFSETNYNCEKDTNGNETCFKLMCVVDADVKYIMCKIDDPYTNTTYYSPDTLIEIDKKEELTNQIYKFYSVGVYFDYSGDSWIWKKGDSPLYSNNCVNNGDGYTTDTKSIKIRIMCSVVNINDSTDVVNIRDEGVFSLTVNDNDVSLIDDGGWIALTKEGMLSTNSYTIKVGVKLDAEKFNNLDNPQSLVNEGATIQSDFTADCVLIITKPAESTSVETTNTLQFYVENTTDLAYQNLYSGYSKGLLSTNINNLSYKYSDKPSSGDEYVIYVYSATTTGNSTKPCGLQNVEGSLENATNLGDGYYKITFTIYGQCTKTIMNGCGTETLTISFDVASTSYTTLCGKDTTSLISSPKNEWTFTDNVYCLDADGKVDYVYDHSIYLQLQKSVDGSNENVELSTDKIEITTDGEYLTYEVLSENATTIKLDLQLNIYSSDDRSWLRVNVLSPEYNNAEVSDTYQTQTFTITINNSQTINVTIKLLIGTGKHTISGWWWNEGTLSGSGIAANSWFKMLLAAHNSNADDDDQLS
jgi:hypothetical protein